MFDGRCLILRRLCCILLHMYSTVVYKSFPDALDALAAKLKSLPFSPDEYHIVLTPDRYTLGAETAIFRNGGSLNTEVLTLSRLCRRVLGAAKMLTREGGVMLTASAIANVSDRLTYYKRAAGYTDFAREVFETLLQIDSSGAELGSLRSSGATAEKIDDLALIRDEYLKLKDDHSDASDRLKDLIAAAKDSSLVKNSHFYAIGYKNHTRLNRDVFDAIAHSARSFCFYDAEPPVPRSELVLLSAPDAIIQYKSVAMRIRDYLYTDRGRARLGDISIICPEPRALLRILDEYGIAYYSDRQTALFDTPPLAALYYIYRLYRGDGEYLVPLCKNPFSGVARVDAERLELYAAERGIEYGLLRESPDDEFARRAVDRINELIDVFGSKSGFAAACAAVSEYARFDECSLRLYADGTDLLGPMRRLTELLDKYGCGAFDADASAFFSAARAVTVNSVPCFSDRVNVTDPQSLRMTRCKKLFVVDFNEGVLPAVTADNGLLSDAEIANTGGAIEPTVREKNRRDREELAAVIANADDVLLAYHTSDGAKRSAFIVECADGRIHEIDCIEEFKTLKGADDVTYIARFACCGAAAREIAARRMSKHYEAVADATDGVMHKAQLFSETVPLTRMSMSVSELTHWFNCPYKRFLTDSVGLKERRSGGASAADFGSVMHEFMRRWIVKKPLDCSREAVEKILFAALDDLGYYVGPRYAVERERLVRDAVDYAALNMRVIDAGDYKPDDEYIERSFGGEIKLGKDEVPFVGIIDRLDVCGDDVRVIDYKTGNKKFDVKKCYDGRDMQLPLYAATQGARVTGMFYLPLRPLYSEGDTLLSGCMVKDADVALSYDKSLSGGARSEIVGAQLKPDGSFVRPSGRIMDRADMDALISMCVDNASAAVDEINSGYIEKTPAPSACDYCPYGGLCDQKKPRGKAEEESV